MRLPVLYALLVGAPLALLLLVLSAGSGLEPGLPAGAAPGPVAAGKEPHFLLTLLLQVVVVLAVARTAGALFRRLGQPRVVGEMVAGIMLGPSLLGWLAPGVSAALFPVESLTYLNALSQIGLLLFMFLVGLEFDPGLLRGRGRTALVTSHVSIVAPFLLGALLALYLYPRLAEGNVEFMGFALFMGAAMSVTAFPVLARILAERNLMHSNVGALTIACAAIDDVTAWSILAVVIAIVRADASTVPLWLTLAGAALFIGVMVLGVRPALRVLEGWYRSRGRVTQELLAVTLLLLLLSALATEWIGIHALFGAFALGAIMPKDPGFTQEITEKLEDVTVVFLLPLFFAFTGLRASIGLVDGAEMWGYAGLILLVAVVGKFGGSTLAARATGLPWRDASALGVLMNTRGLMELVILSIGLELGVISPVLFTMMVMMALITTFMTTPLLEVVYPARLIRQQATDRSSPAAAFRTLIPVSLPSAGPALLATARLLAPAGRSHEVFALHLHVAGEQSLTRMQPDQLPSRERVLLPLLDAAPGLGVRVRPLSFVSRDPGVDIVEIADTNAVDLILLGSHRPIISQSVVGGTVAEVLTRAPCDVAVLIDRGSTRWQSIVVPWAGDSHDVAALELARRVAAHAGISLTVLRIAPDLTLPAGPAPTERVLDATPGDPIQAVIAEIASGHDLLVVGASRAWGLEPTLFAAREEALAGTSATLLLVRRHGTSM